MTRGNQREIDRARAQARDAKKPQKAESGQNQVNRQMSDAEIMREKQRRAELKAQGIDPDAEDQGKEKKFDDSYLKKYQVDYGEEQADEEEEKKEEELPVKQPSKPAVQKKK